MIPTISPTYFNGIDSQVIRKYHCTASGLHVWRYFLEDDNGRIERFPFSRIIHNPVRDFFTVTTRIPGTENNFARASYDNFETAEEFALGGYALAIGGRMI